MSLPAHKAPPAQSTSIVTALYLRTKELHTQAEKTGIIRDLLRGEAGRDDYMLLLRNLHPAYAALERGLADDASLATLAAFAFDRASAIARDMTALSGADWTDRVPLLDEGKAYAACIERAAREGGGRLIAHAYTRYLGDLSGGLILKKLLARSLELQPSQLGLYHFAGDPAVLKNDYREALEDAARNGDAEAIIEEGAAAFEMNIALSCAIKDRGAT